MKIAIIGANGNMGRRYTAICKWLKHDVLPIDTYNIQHAAKIIISADKVIVASPVDVHCAHAKLSMLAGKDVLIEKPVAKTLAEIKELAGIALETNVNARMVCNWKFLAPIKHIKHIYVNHYNLGPDMPWDLIQPMYLTDSLCVRFDMPYYLCLINKTEIDKDMFDMSYIDMMRSFLNDSDLLWNINDAYKATCKVLQYIDNKLPKGVNFDVVIDNTSAVGQQAVSG